MTRLQQRLGYVFKDVELLQRALSHRSVGAGNNERLEFLGDAILGFEAADLASAVEIGLRERVARGLLRHIKVAGFRIQRTLWIARHRSKLDHPVVEAFIRAVRGAEAA